MNNKIQLYDLRIDKNGWYQAFSLYNSWSSVKGSKLFAEEQGKRHQAALEYLLRGDTDIDIVQLNHIARRYEEQQEVYPNPYRPE